MTEEMIIAAYCKIRTIDNSIADDVLDFMKDAAIQHLKPHTCKEFDCELTTMLENIPQNLPLYKDSGRWQIRTDDMEGVIFEQGVEESFFDFIKRAYTKENSFMSASED